MDIVTALTTFLDNGELLDESMLSAHCEVGDVRLRVVAIKLLGWLKSQHQTGRQKPLALNKKFEWCNDLKKLISSEIFFSDVLMVDGDSLDFARDISPDLRRQLCAEADRKYTPRLMT